MRRYLSKAKRKLSIVGWERTKGESREERESSRRKIRLQRTSSRAQHYYLKARVVVVATYPDLIVRVRRVCCCWMLDGHLVVGGWTGTNETERSSRDVSLSKCKKVSNHPTTNGPIEETENLPQEWLSEPLRPAPKRRSPLSTLDPDLNPLERQQRRKQQRRARRLPSFLPPPSPPSLLPPSNLLPSPSQESSTGAISISTPAISTEPWSPADPPRTEEPRP